jgi:predicted MFS family arabinose efflux permease
MNPASLFRDRRVSALLVAEVVSTTGSQMTWLALPWFVLVTTGSASRMGLVLAAEVAGVGLLGIPGGAVAARLGPRRTLVLSNLGAGAAVAAVPMLHALDALSFGLLLALVFAAGALWAPQFSAQRVALAELLDDDEARVSDANALLQAATRATLLLGPVLAGVLISAIGAPAVLVVDAATFAFAVVTIGVFVPRTPPAVAPSGDDPRGLFAGLRYLAHDRLLRAWTVSMAVGDAAWNALFASLPFYAYTRYDADPRVAGLLLACFGVGAVIGNALSFRLRPKFDALSLVAVAVVAQALPLWLLLAAGPAWVVGFALIASGVANGVANPSLHAMLTLRAPQALRQQVLSAVLAADMLASPLGYLGAGVALAHAGVLPLFAAVAGTQTVAMGSRAAITLRERRALAAAAAG